VDSGSILSISVGNNSEEDMMDGVLWLVESGSLRKGVSKTWGGLEYSYGTGEIRIESALRLLMRG
jgi:hypothetical protein